MQHFHTTWDRASKAITREGFVWQDSAHPQSYDGSYIHADGRRAYIDGATYQSFDRAGKHWFRISVRSN
jgi:hypothetical protein